MSQAAVVSSSRRDQVWFWLLLAVMTGLRWAVASRTQLSDDESYYWLWSRALQLSYFDHPAMVAYWIKLGTLAAGDGALGVRLLSIVGTAVVSWLVFDLGRLAFGSTRAGLTCALWLNATILFGVGGVIITPDAPMALFWTLALWALVRLIQSERPVWLYVAGVALGLGAISKYTMALMIPGALATMVLYPGLRRWFASRHLYFALAVAAACTTPLIVWNVQNEFISFHKQWGHAFDTKPASAWGNFGAFVGSQLGLVTPLVAGFALWGMAWALAAGWRQRRPEWFLLGAVSAPVIAFFLQHTFTGAVQAQWAAPGWIGGIVAAGGFTVVAERGPVHRLWRGLFRAAPVLGLALVGVVYLQALTAILPLPVKIDPTARLSGWDGLAAAVQDELDHHPGAFVFTGKHQLMGELSFYMPGHPKVFLSGVRVRPPYLSRADVDALDGRAGILVMPTNDDNPHDYDRDFTAIAFLREVTLRHDGRAGKRYRLYLCEGYRPGLF